MLTLIITLLDCYYCITVCMENDLHIGWRRVIMRVSLAGQVFPGGISIVVSYCHSHNH